MGYISANSRRLPSLKECENVRQVDRIPGFSFEIMHSLFTLILILAIICIAEAWYGGWGGGYREFSFLSLYYYIVYSQGKGSCLLHKKILHALPAA